MQYLPQHGELPHENVEGTATGRGDALYEPRALWQVVDIPFTNQRERPGATRVLEGVEWMNGSRYDMVFTHLNICPIGYAVLHDAYEVLQNVSVTVSHGNAMLASSPYMPALGQMQPNSPSPAFFDASMGQYMPFDYSPLAGTVNPRTRLIMPPQFNTFDVARWQFDMPYRLIRKGLVTFGLSSIGAVTNYGIAHERGRLRMTMGFDEAWSTGGLLRQQMRIQEGHLYTSDVLTQTPFNGVPIQSGTPDAPPAVPTNLWPADSQFQSKVWRRQEAGRGGGDGSGWLQGFTVHLPNYHNVDNLDRIADGETSVSLATRIGCRAKTVNGGTGRSWWRDGAPLALVSPTIGAAHTIKLQTPIRLASKEQLIVTLRTEGKDNLLAGIIDEDEVEQDRSSAGNFKVGVSVTGYAIVKD